PGILLRLRLDRLRQRDFLRTDAQVGAADSPIGFEAGYYALRDIHGNRPSVTAAEHPAIHPNGAPVDVNQRTAAESRIKRRVGLDEVLDLAAAPSAPGGRNRTDGPECRLQAAGAADRQDDLSRLQVVDLGTGHGRCGQA